MRRRRLPEGRGRVTTYRLVGGPMHRETRDCQSDQLRYAEPAESILAFYSRETPDAPFLTRTGYYRAERIFGSGGWKGDAEPLRFMLHESISPGSPEAYRLVLDAFLPDLLEKWTPA